MNAQRSALTLMLVLALLPPAAAASQVQPAAASHRPASQPALPPTLLFVENAGQWPAVARFQVWGGPGTMWLAEDAIWVALASESDSRGSEGQRSDKRLNLTSGPRSLHSAPLRDFVRLCVRRFRPF